MKKICIALLVLFSMMAAKATILLQDSLNYPYNNGLIATQGQWYVYYPTIPTNDAYVENNVLILNTTNHDSVATPTNGWAPNGYTFASFELNVSQLPASTNGGYFAQLQNNNDTDDCCHVFIDTQGTTVPGTYRLGIGNFTTSFSAVAGPPNNFPVDLATNVPYTVVILFDTTGDNLAGATLYVNPSVNDYNDDVYGENDYYTGVTGAGVGGSFGFGFAYATDTTTNSFDLNLVPTQIAFSPYVDAGVSNVIAGTEFADVNVTNPPVWGIQPQSQTNNYSGNPTTYYAVASGVDLAYQWYSTNYGALNDGPSYGGVTFIGSQSNTLVINNQQSSDVYYAVVTDAYGNTNASSLATNTVITTSTAPFFTEAYASNNVNLFTTAGFTNAALGTGPLSYQWYFASTNHPGVYSALSGQTSPALNLFLGDYTYDGTFYVVASNSVSGGSIAYGPTNTLVILAPVVATISQIHNLMYSEAAQIAANKSGTVFVNSNNVVVAGYVTSFYGTGSSYREWYLQDAGGYGIQVYLPGYGNTNVPPVGTYMTVTGPVSVYETGLQIQPASPTNCVVSSAPVIPLAPVLGTSVFNTLVTNGLGAYAISVQESLFTFTNCYLYTTKTGGALGTSSNAHFGGSTTQFDAGSYTEAYFTIGQYGVPASNTNAMEIFQPTYNFGTNSSAPGFASPFTGRIIPSHLYQLTGAYENFEGTPEIEPSRPADWVTSAPQAPTVTITSTPGGPKLTWFAGYGSTYSVSVATNLNGPWAVPSSTPAYPTYGLGYYPTNSVSYIDSNTVPATKFYSITSP